MITTLRRVSLAVTLIAATASWAGSSTYGGGPKPIAAKPPPPPPPPPPVDETEGDMRGATLMVGLGAEGFTGPLASRIHVGPGWAAAVVFKPTVVLGIELAYTGSADVFDPSRLFGSGRTTGATVIRHGGHAAISVGLTASRVQPYLMAGVGINRYFPINALDSGYRSVTNATLPLGAGLRVYFVGKFTLDLRANYTLSFGENFAGGVGAIEGFNSDSLKDIGRWSATAFFGYTF